MVFKILDFSMLNFSIAKSSSAGANNSTLVVHAMAVLRSLSYTVCHNVNVKPGVLQGDGRDQEGKFNG